MLVNLLCRKENTPDPRQRTLDGSHYWQFLSSLQQACDTARASRQLQNIYIFIFDAPLNQLQYQLVYILKHFKSQVLFFLQGYKYLKLCSGPAK